MFSVQKTGTHHFLVSKCFQGNLSMVNFVFFSQILELVPIKQT